MFLLIFLLMTILSSLLLNCRGFQSYERLPRIKPSAFIKPSTKLFEGISTTGSVIVKNGKKENIDLLRRWYLLNHQKRTEVTFSNASSIDTMITDIWKSILISFQVLDNNFDGTKSFSQLYAFPNMKHEVDMNEKSFKSLEIKLNHILKSHKVLFQPDFNYQINFISNNPNSDPSSSSLPLDLSFIVLIDTYHTKEDFTAFNDIQNLLPLASAYESVLPKLEDTQTNQIPNFPFPSIYDFISEINRPIDPFTMSNLKFKFTTLDLRFSAEQMKKKKKNPQGRCRCMSVCPFIPFIYMDIYLCSYVRV